MLALLVWVVAVLSVVIQAQDRSASVCPSAPWTHGPPLTIIAGIGDSGTRGVASTIQQLTGAHLCANFVEGREDCAIMAWRLLNGNDFSYLLRRVVEHNASVGAVTPTLQQVPFVDTEHVAGISRKMCSALLQLWNSKATQEDIERRGVWGFKSHWLALPLWVEVLGSTSRLKYIHVIRNGPDIALGDNQNQFSKYCSAMSSGCNSGVASRVAWWHSLNNMVIRYLGEASECNW